MKAIVQDTYGSTDVLELRDVDRPGISDHEVLVRVHAAGVSRGVWHLMTGQPYFARLAGLGLRKPKQPTPGTEMAGVVEAVGSAVTRLRPGDEVFGMATGAFGEYARAAARKIAHKPTSLSFVQAAAVPDSGSTALQALRDHGRVQAGQRVLIIGASGGVGTYAVQLAKTFGAHVTGVCSTAKVDLVTSLGADHVVDYTAEEVTNTGAIYDLILDIGGNRRLTPLRRCLTDRGALIIIGGETGGRWVGGFDRPLRATLLSPFVRQKLGTFVAAERYEDFDHLAELIADGTIAPVVDRTYELDDTPAAIRHLEQGQARGKLVITI